MPKNEKARERLGDKQRHVRYSELSQVDDVARQSATMNAREDWLEMIRTLARSAARADHEAVIRHDKRSR
jgi:hypothetical protein